MTRRRCALRCHTMRTRNRVNDGSSNLPSATRRQTFANMITITTMLILLLPLHITTATAATASQGSGVNQQREGTHAATAAGTNTAAAKDALQLHSNVAHKSNLINAENKVSAREARATELLRATQLNYSNDASAEGGVLVHEGGTDGKTHALKQQVGAAAINYRVEQLARNASEMRPQKQKLQTFLTAALRRPTAATVRNFTTARHCIPSKVPPMSSTTGNNKLVTMDYMASNNSYTNGGNNNNSNSSATKWRQAIDVRPLEKRQQAEIERIEQRANSTQLQQSADGEQQQQIPINGSKTHISGKGKELEGTALSERTEGSTQSNNQMEFLTTQATTATTTAQVSRLSAQLGLGNSGTAASADRHVDAQLSAEHDDGVDYSVDDAAVISSVAKITNNSVTQMLQFVMPATRIPTTTSTIREVNPTAEIVLTGAEHARENSVKSKINNINSKTKFTSTQFQSDHSDATSAQSIAAVEARTAFLSQTTGDYPAESDFRTESVPTQLLQPTPRGNGLHAIQSRNPLAERLPNELNTVSEGGEVRRGEDNNNTGRRLTPLTDLNVKLNVINKNAKSVKCDKQIKNDSTAMTIESMTGHEQAKHERATQNDASEVAAEAQQALKTAQEDCKITKCSKRLGAIVQGEQQAPYQQRRQPQKSFSENQLTRQQRYLGQALHLVRPQQQAQGLNAHTEQLQKYNKHLEPKSDFLAELTGQQTMKEGEMRSAVVERKSLSEAEPLLNTEVAQMESGKLAEKPSKVSSILQEEPALSEVEARNQQFGSHKQEAASRAKLLTDAAQDSNSKLGELQLEVRCNETSAKQNNLKPKHSATRVEKRESTSLNEPNTVASDNLVRHKNSDAKSAKILITSTGGTMPKKIAQHQVDKSTAEANLWQQTETERTIADSVAKQAASTSANATYNESSEGQMPEEQQRALKYANNRDNSATVAALNRWPQVEWYKVPTAMRLAGLEGKQAEQQQPVDTLQDVDVSNADFNGQRQANKSRVMAGIELLHITNITSNATRDAHVAENRREVHNGTNLLLPMKMVERVDVRQRLMSDKHGVDTEEMPAFEISINNSLSYGETGATHKSHAAPRRNGENVSEEENAEPEMLNLTKAQRSASTSTTEKSAQIEVAQAPTTAATKPDNCEQPAHNGNEPPFEELKADRAHEGAQETGSAEGINNEYLARLNGAQAMAEQQQSKSILPLPHTDYADRAEGETVSEWQQQHNLLTAYIRRPDQRTGEALKLNDTLLAADGKAIVEAESEWNAGERSTIQEPFKSSAPATMTTETISPRPAHVAENTMENNWNGYGWREKVTADGNFEASQNEKANAQAAQIERAELPSERDYKAVNLTAVDGHEYGATGATFSNQTGDNFGAGFHALNSGATSATSNTTAYTPTYKTYVDVSEVEAHYATTAKQILERTTTAWTTPEDIQWQEAEQTTRSNHTYTDTIFNSAEIAAGHVDTTDSIPTATMQAVMPPLISLNTTPTSPASSAITMTIPTAVMSDAMYTKVPVQSVLQAAIAANVTINDMSTTTTDTSFFVLPNFAALTTTTSTATEYALFSTTPGLITPTIGATATPGGAAWPVKHASVMEGDVILGGLMMVHSREDSITCGPIMPQGGIQALEAMLYTLDQVNKQQLLPNVTLGAHILDDCDKDTYGLEMAVDFIKGSISNIDDAEYHCNKTQVRKVISGVVGAASSVTSIQVANLLRLFRIPQVSFFSTSPELSNKQRFEYFSRTIPSDHYQVKAMVEIVKRMGWSYVSIIYEESNYGIKAFEELEELLARHNICIAVKEKLVKDSGVAEEIAYDNIVQKLLTKPRARGAIIFGSDQEVREVMRAVRRNNATGAFSWIGSDGWSARNLVSDGNEPEVEGTLSVQPQANPVKGFEEYFLNLTVENNQRNPWFVEFWEDHFQCRYPGSLSTPYNNYNRTCTTKERLSKDTDFEDQLQFVSDAVMAFAYALRDMHRDLCGGRPSLCDAMRPTKGADLLKYLRKVQFQGLSGDHFRFDANGDGPARYNIIHFKQSAEGLYHWIKVGEYYEGELRLNMTEVQFKLLHPKPPESVCSLPCERGQAKKYVEGESCCWHCFNCSTYQIRHPIDETQCLTCQLGTLPDVSKQFCQTIPEVYLRPESAWAIGAMAFSATGILVTLFVVGVFVRHNDTPIVRASGRELSYILLAGILMCYAVTFALVLKPTNIVCAIQRFSVGFCFTVVYAALLTKTNRIARIFKAGKQSAKRPSFISPKSQLVICSFLIFIQILINGVWMVIAPSHAMYHHPTREDNLLVCDSYIDASYMIAFFYPILLIVVCTVYAVLTRKIPEAFNESKHIGFTMYTTCVIWLAFVPLYFGTANHVPLRITSMSVTISLSASVTVACLFSPKLYIILIRPERNVRQSMMPPRYGNMHRAGTGPSSMMAAAVVTAATCAQEEKIQKHITPTNTEHSTKAKKLCEMATQTITITNIFTNLDSIAYSQIPYADQYVPNNNHQQQHEQQNLQSSHHHPLAENSEAEVVANNNKINQLQHGNPNATNTATATATTANTAATSATAVAAINTAVSPPTLHALSNHVMLQQHVALHNCSDSATMCSDSGRPQLETTNL
ncbi:uncharacterized protein LOC105228043 isoform X1 [Bactrocera dorsalis]|uniref:Uncharacterized protein LOC105228043 isoform X1 n=2 Tax=Bactrocera dorsalis TaxID=27457 RepID=A0ABM3JC36_BACDO|nr:uncharacterized protein LOC105228043 isoform X1 [Bactrocera dorsalis]